MLICSMNSKLSPDRTTCWPLVTSVTLYVPAFSRGNLQMTSELDSTAVSTCTSPTRQETLGNFKNPMPVTSTSDDAATLAGCTSNSRGSSTYSNRARPAKKSLLLSATRTGTFPENWLPGARHFTAVEDTSNAKLQSSPIKQYKFPPVAFRL